MSQVEEIMLEENEEELGSFRRNQEEIWETTRNSGKQADRPKRIIEKLSELYLRKQSEDERHNKRLSERY